MKKEIKESLDEGLKQLFGKMKERKMKEKLLRG